MNSEFCLPLLVEALAKSIPIILGAALLERVWPQASAARRHLIWGAALVVVLLLPATRVFQPRWSVPLQRVTVEIPPVNPAAVTFAGAFSPSPATVPVTRSHPRWRWPDRKSSLLLVWVMGAGLLLMRRLAGSVRLLHLRFSTERVADQRALGLVAEILRESGIHRRVEFRLSPMNDVPITWGTLRPVLMLPAEALAWDDARLTAALRHEVGHIARGDHFTRWLASLACALYWPNPLVWFAARRLRVTQEQATDDLVLRAGSAPDEYAEQLFEVARTLAARRGLFRTALAMASPSTLECRLLAIVDAERDRRPLSWRALAGGILAILLTLGLATAAQLQAQENVAPSAMEKPGEAKEPQIEIDARFVEITSTEARPEGIAQWLNGLLTDDLGQPIKGAGPSSPAANAQLPTIQGIITPAQCQIVLRRLSQKKGVDLLSTPRVTTRSGQRAVIEIVRDFGNPTKWKKKGESPKTESSTSVELEKDDQTWTPKAPETRKVGVTLEVLAEIRAGGTIDLEVTPCVTEFEGFIDLDGDSNPPPDAADVITRRDKSGRMLTSEQPGRRMQPVFSEQKLTSSVGIFAGQTVVIGSENEFAGTTDPSKNKLYRQLLVFVTARVVKENPAADATTKMSAPVESPAMAKARKIIVPKVEFRDVTVVEALDFLRMKARELDNEKQGVNLILKPSSGPNARMSLSLTNVPLSEALLYVASLANLELVAEPNTLVLQPPAAGATLPVSSAQASTTHQLAVAPQPEKIFLQSDRIDITEFSGSASTLEVGGTYRLKGTCRQESLANATLYVGITATTGDSAIVAARGSSLFTALHKGSTEFDVTFTILRPGQLHVTIYDLDNKDPKDNAYAGLLLGEAKAN